MKKEDVLKRAIDNAIGSMEIEGFTYTEEDKQVVRDLVEGKISKEVLLNKIIKGELTKEAL